MMIQFLKNNKLVIIGVIIALIALVAWWLFLRKPKDQDKDSKDSGTGKNTSTGGSNSGSGSGSGGGTESTNNPPSVFPLKAGSKGKEVVALQKFLNNADSSYKLKVDGIFGPLTEAAVKKELPGAVSTVSQDYYSDFVKRFEEKPPLRS